MKKFLSVFFAVFFIRHPDDLHVRDLERHGVAGADTGGIRNHGVAVGMQQARADRQGKQEEKGAFHIFQIIKSMDGPSGTGPATGEQALRQFHGKDDAEDDAQASVHTVTVASGETVVLPSTGLAA